MKRKLMIAAGIVLVFLVGFTVWYAAPIDFVDLEPDEVKEIVIFNGNTGRAAHITEKAQLAHILQNFNAVKVKRSELSPVGSGFNLRVTIYLTDGNEADGWNNFIVNSEHGIRKNPFLYTVVSGKLDYDALEQMTEQAS